MGGKDKTPEEGMAEPILAGQDEYQRCYQDNIIATMQGKSDKSEQADVITNNQALLLEDGPSFPPTSALTLGGR